MSSSFERARRLAAVNQKLPCSTRGCTRRRKFTTKYCDECGRRDRFYGASTAGAITKTMYQPHLNAVRELFEAHPEHAGLLAADALMAQILEPGPDRPRPTKRHYQHGLAIARWRVHVELRRLREGMKRGRWGTWHSPLTPRLAVEIVCAVWLLSKESPGILPDDKRLTRALANCIFRAVPLDIRRSSYDHKRRQVRAKYSTPGATCLDEFGGRLRAAFGVFAHHVAQGVEARRQRENQIKGDIRQPFTRSVSEDASPRSASEDASPSAKGTTK